MKRALKMKETGFVGMEFDARLKCYQLIVYFQPNKLKYCIFFLYFFFCLTSEIGKEEQQVDKEDKDPWWKPKDLKEDLSKGSVTIAFIFS